jgi:hypothetical protein
MNLNNYVVYRRLWLGPLHQLHPAGETLAISVATDFVFDA